MPGAIQGEVDAPSDRYDDEQLDTILTFLREATDAVE